MRRIATAAFTAAMTLATPALSQSFVGEWIATAHVQDTEISERVSVAKSGDGYTIIPKLLTPPGEGAPPTPEAGPATNIKLEGDNFSYSRTVDFSGNKIEILYKGVVTGDTFKGTADAGGNTIVYTGVRAK